MWGLGFFAGTHEAAWPQAAPGGCGCTETLGCQAESTSCAPHMSQKGSECPCTSSKGCLLFLNKPNARSYFSFSSRFTLGIGHVPDLELEIICEIVK